MQITPKTLIEAIQYFSDGAVCIDYMAGVRWPDGVTCPTCGSRNITFLATRRLWKCKEKHARQQFSVKVGTILEDSPIPLSKWLPAIWLLASAKNDISSYEIARSLGITQKSAWFMLHRIRLAMQIGTFQRMCGEVEADETFVGGKAKFMHKDKRASKITGTGGIAKTAVMGLLERHGQMVTATSELRLSQTLAGRPSVAKSVSTCPWQRGFHRRLGILYWPGSRLHSRNHRPRRSIR